VEADEILTLAAGDIAQHGHAKETFYQSTGTQTWEVAPACALGAIARVSGCAREGNGIVTDAVFSTEAVRRLAGTIRGKLGGSYATADDYLTITGFNDDDSTTAEDVILMMKEAANG
jgi:hypothetical protein